MRTLRNLLLSFFCLLLSSNYQAKAQDEYITVKKSDLAPDVVAQLEQQKKLQAVNQNMQTVSEITKNASSIGHEIGIAFDEALTAVTKHAATFGKTEVGQFTMFMVAWAVMADEIPTLYKTVLGTVFGIPFIIFANIMLFNLYRLVTTQRKRIKSVSENGKKEYEYIDTWYTNLGSRGTGSGLNVEDRAWFNALFFIFAFGANIWIISGVIL